MQKVIIQAHGYAHIHAHFNALMINEENFRNVYIKCLSTDRKKEKQNQIKSELTKKTATKIFTNT